MATEKREVDWKVIERDYRAGIKTLRAIAEEHGISHAAVGKKAKRFGWSRAIGIREDRSISVVDVDELNAAGFVYGIYIDAGGERIYKVGLAKNPVARLDAHQVSLPFDAKLGIAYFVPNMRSEERKLHEMFAPKLVRGEWYRLDDNDLNMMAMRSRLA